MAKFKKIRAAGSALLLLAAAGTASGEQTCASADYDLGEYLAAECSGCHRQGNHDARIPSIGGRSVTWFMLTMGHYRDKLRPNLTMQSVAQSLNADELCALAVYLQQFNDKGAQQ